MDNSNSQMGVSTKETTEEESRKDLEFFSFRIRPIMKEIS